MRTRRTTAELSALAAGWQTSGLRQEEYARQHGISGRTLRALLRRFHRPVEIDHVVAVIDRAMKELGALRRQATAMPVGNVEPCRPQPEPAPVDTHVGAVEERSAPVPCGNAAQVPVDSVPTTPEGAPTLSGNSAPVDERVSLPHQPEMPPAETRPGYVLCTSGFLKGAWVRVSKQACD